MILLEQIFGKADSKFSGVKGAVAEMVGVDIHSTPGLIKVHQKLTKESGATVTELCKVRIAASNGYSFWFSADSGKIWARTSVGVWSLAYTTSPAAGEAKCLGAAEFNGYIYWATQSRLHRIAIADADDAWASVSLDWATFSVCDSSFHPMQVQNNILFIGDGNLVASVNASGTFADGSSKQANTLDIKTPHRIKTIIDFDIDLLLGTHIADTVNNCQVVRWDTESDSWITSDPIEENGINAFIRDDNYVYVQAGQFGKIYLYNGEQLVPFKRIPGDWSPTKTAVIHPQAVSTLLTIPVFGLSNVAGNPCYQGVYSFGSYSKDYPKILDLSYPVSTEDLTGVEVGAVLAIGADLLVAWKVGASCGVDKLDWTAKYASAFIETMMVHFGGVRQILKTLMRVFANYASLPTNTNIKFKYKKKHEASFNDYMTTIDDTDLMQIRSEDSIPDVANLQLRIEFVVSGNNGPEVESLGYLDSISEQ